jgi:hypothetical protein
MQPSSLRERITKLRKKISSAVIKRLFPIRWKEWNELKYWERVRNSEGVLSNDHYRHFYTAHFGLDASHYDGKVILDIGCGPRGSLEWADAATDCEPHELTPGTIINLLAPEFECEQLEVYAPVENGMYRSILAGRQLPDPHHTREIGYLSAKFKRKDR